MPEYLALDDTLISGKRRAVWVDIKRKIQIDIQEGYAEKNIREFAKVHLELWGGAPKGIVIDPDVRFRSVLENLFPGTVIILDRFHVAFIINKSRDNWLKAYRSERNIKLSIRSLRKPKKIDDTTDTQSLEEHPSIRESVEYIDSWKELYNFRTAAEARLYWASSIKNMPDYLIPYFHKVIHLDKNWRTELCVAVEHRMINDKGEEVIISNGITEALHKRAYTKEALAGRMTFETSRIRMLAHIGEQKNMREAQY